MYVGMRDRLAGGAAIVDAHVKAVGRESLGKDLSHPSHGLHPLCRDNNCCLDRHEMSDALVDDISQLLRRPDHCRSRRTGAAYRLLTDVVMPGMMGSNWRNALA